MVWAIGVRSGQGEHCKTRPDLLEDRGPARPPRTAVFVLMICANYINKCGISHNRYSQTAVGARRVYVACDKVTKAAGSPEARPED